MPRPQMCFRVFLGSLVSTRPVALVSTFYARSLISLFCSFEWTPRSLRLQQSWQRLPTQAHRADLKKTNSDDRTRRPCQ